MRRFPFALIVLAAAALLPPLLAADESAKPALASEPAPISLDDPVLPLEPKHPRTDAERDRAQAEALFAVGSMLQQRGEVVAALRRYERAARYDAEALPPLRSAIDLALALRRNAEAGRYAIRYAELAPKDAARLQTLGRILAAADKLPEAQRLYQLALAVGEKKPPSPDWAQLLVEFGRLQYIAKQYKPAAETLARLTKLLDADGPYQAVATVLNYELMVECFLEADRPDDAAAASEKLEKLAPNKGQFAFNLARVDFKKKRYAEAIEHLQTFFATPDASQGTAPYDLLADVLKADGKEQEFLPRLEKLHETNAENVVLTFVLAQRYLKAEKYEPARALYAQVLAAQPAADAFQGAIEVELKSKQFPALLKLLGAAAEKYKTALAAALGDVTQALTTDADTLGELMEAVRKEGDRLDPQAALALGALALDAKQFDMAEGYLEQGLRPKPAGSKSIDGKSLDSKSIDTGDWLRFWGLELFLDDKFEPATALFQRGLEAKPSTTQSVDLYFLLASSLAMSDKTDAALEAARKAASIQASIDGLARIRTLGAKPRKEDLDQDNKSLRLRSRIAWIEYHAKRNDDAFKSYGELIEKFDPICNSEGDRDQLREARSALSALCVLRGDTPQAEEWLEQVLDEFPDDSGAGNDLGYLWADENKRLDRALPLIQRAVAAEPENAAYRDSLGWIYFRLDRYADAEKELLKATAGDDPDGAVLDHLGDVYMKLKRPDKAADAWNRALKPLEKEADAARLEAVRNKIKSLHK